MKERILFVLLMAFLLLAIQNRFFDSPSLTLSTANPNSITSRDSDINASSTLSFVTRVIDGDTIEVSINNSLEKVRFIGVDTPETVDPRKPVQCFGKEASTFTTSLLSVHGQAANQLIRVRLEADSSQDNRDKYGRLLRYVFLEDGTLINEKIISDGYGHEYTYRVPYKYQSEFKTAEKNARELQKGLWSPSTCAV